MEITAAVVNGVNEDYKLEQLRLDEMIPVQMKLS